jgi:hypothetical protein
MRNLIDEILDETIGLYAYEAEDMELDFSNSSTYLPFMQNLATIAKQELARWQNGTKDETDPSMTAVLKDYYKTGVKKTVSDTDLRSKTWHRSNPWSAVFISWVLRTGGAGPYFKYSSAHWRYIADAKEKRENGDFDSVYWAYRITERSPQLGDLLCNIWGDSRLTYDTVQNGGHTHCDMVTEVYSDKVVAIGGNVGGKKDGSFGGSVAKKTFYLNANGKIDTRKHPDHFAVLSIY